MSFLVDYLLLGTKHRLCGVAVAALRTDASAGAAADTVGGVGESHDRSGVVFVVILVIVHFHFFAADDEIEHAARADLEAAAATDAHFLVDLDCRA